MKLTTIILKLVILTLPGAIMGWIFMDWLNLLPGWAFGWAVSIGCLIVYGNEGIEYGRKSH